MTAVVTVTTAAAAVQWRPVIRANSSTRQWPPRRPGKHAGPGLIAIRALAPASTRPTNAAQAAPSTMTRLAPARRQHGCRQQDARGDSEDRGLSQNGWAAQRSRHTSRPPRAVPPR